jgi:hypothetical protein
VSLTAAAAAARQAMLGLLSFVCSSSVCIRTVRALRLKWLKTSIAAAAATLRLLFSYLWHPSPRPV